ncbi:methylosome subunit pICln-like [Daphnia carinata]|uniref:methylosome subunit pICln-like n=1 Tax=Daphnia carinata TaxID=120202 RepID=UPI00257C4DAC|nr:methylosome subunit pICln-like [Daphnia carinata]
MVVLSSFPPPAEGIKLVQPNTGAFINTRDLGQGTLYIAESRVSWVSASSGQGFSLEYPHISLHAVSKDPAAFPQECLYLMLDSRLDEPDEIVENDDSGDEESTSEMSEVRFIPEDRGTLDAMYHAMTVCQTLHPDPNDSVSDEGDFEDTEEGEYCLDAGESADNDHDNGETENMESDMGQFEDADPEH